MLRSWIRKKGPHGSSWHGWASGFLSGGSLDISFVSLTTPDDPLLLLLLTVKNEIGEYWVWWIRPGDSKARFKRSNLNDPSSWKERAIRTRDTSRLRGSVSFLFFFVHGTPWLRTTTVEQDRCSGLWLEGTEQVRGRWEAGELHPVQF